MNRRISRLIISLLALGALIFIGYYSTFYIREKQIGGLVKQDKALKDELQYTAGKGYLFAEGTQSLTSGVHVAYANFMSPGFIVVSQGDRSDKSNDGIVKQFYWGKSKLLKPGEYNGVLIEQNLEKKMFPFLYYGTVYG